MAALRSSLSAHSVALKRLGAKLNHCLPTSSHMFLWVLGHVQEPRRVFPLKMTRISSSDFRALNTDLAGTPLTTATVTSVLHSG